MEYFKDCQTADDAKNLFNKLCFELHPDHGGSDKEFIEMYKQAQNFKPSSGKDKDFNASKYYNLFKQFEVLSGVEVTFIGSFIWLKDIDDGATYRQRETIKNINPDGFRNPRFSRKRKAWYYSPEGYKQRRKSNKSLSELKSFYGGKSFEAKGSTRISA